MNTPGQPHDVVLLVDIANVMGSRPDGWWRDRAAAATRLLIALEPLNGAEITVPGELGMVRITEVRAVLEGAAKRAEGPQAVTILRADRDGDSEIVEEASQLSASGRIPLVVTADRRAASPPSGAGPHRRTRVAEPSPGTLERRTVGMRRRLAALARLWVRRARPLDKISATCSPRESRLRDTVPAGTRRSGSAIDRQRCGTLLRKDHEVPSMASRGLRAWAFRPLRRVNGLARLAL